MNKWVFGGAMVLLLLGIPAVISLLFIPIIFLVYLGLIFVWGSVIAHYIFTN